MGLKQELFPHLEYQTYINHAAMSPLSTRAMTAMEHLMGRFARLGVSAWKEGGACRARVREKLAQLIGADAGDIGLIQNTSHGILVVANEYPWREGDRILLFRGEFPGNVMPWLATAARRRLEVIWLDLDDLHTRNEAFQQAMARRPRLMAISWVQYQTGLTQSLAFLSRLRAEHGIHICLDAIQGLGPLVMNLRHTPLDFVVCGGHKWLMSPEGTGFLFIHPEHVPAMDPLLVSWLSQEDPVSFLFKGDGYVDYAKPFRSETERVEMATMNNIGIAGMETGIDLLLEVGPEKVQDSVLALAHRCRQGLKALGVKTEDTRAYAGNVSFKLPPDRLKIYFRELEDAGILVSTPDGRLRVSAHFYNDEGDIDRFLDKIASLRRGQG